jgi:hypothetical protein
VVHADHRGERVGLEVSMSARKALQTEGAYLQRELQQVEAEMAAGRRGPFIRNAREILQGRLAGIRKVLATQQAHRPAVVDNG